MAFYNNSFNLCFGVNAQEMQKIFDSKKPLYEKLINYFPNYLNMDDSKKIDKIIWSRIFQEDK